MTDLWTIGTPQTLPYDLPGHQDEDGITCTIGHMEGKTWSGFQPGPQNAATHCRDYPFVITFELDDVVDSWYALTIDYLVLKAGTSQLRAELNDYAVLAYLDVEMASNVRERPAVYNVISGSGCVTLHFPASAVRRGHNILTLRLVEVIPSTEKEALQSFWLPAHKDFWGNGLHYTCLRFHLASSPAVLSLDLVPTPFYRHEERLGLTELVEVRMTFAQPFTTGTVSLNVNGYTVNVVLAAVDYQSGMLRCAIAVPMPESQALLPARLVVTLDDYHQQAEIPIRPCRRWTLHLMPHVHLDLGYTDFQGKVAETHARNLDHFLEIVQTRPDYTFVVDGTWIIEQYQATRHRRQVDAVFEAARRGNLSIQAFYEHFLTNFASLEEFYRSTYLAGHLACSEHITLKYANITDIPTYSGATPSILAALDIPYFLGISNHGRAASPEATVLHALSPVRWQGPDGAEVLAFFPHHYFQTRFLFGDPALVARGVENLPRFLSIYDRSDYLPDTLPIFGTHMDNEDLASGYADLVERWNAQFAYPRLTFSTPATYFATVENQRARLPLVSGDGGSFWEDGAAAGAHLLATYYRNQSTLFTSELLLSLITTSNTTLRVPRERLNEAWRKHMIGGEHTWTHAQVISSPESEQSTSQLAWKEAQVYEAARISQDMLLTGMSQLAEQVTTDGTTLLIFNPCSWSRSDIVEVDLARDAQLQDGTTGAFLRLDKVKTLSETERLDRVRFMARDVPALGYRTYRIHQAALSTQVEPVALALDTPEISLETEYYQLTLNPTTGMLLSLVDRQLGQELIDTVDGYSLGDYLYVEGGGSEIWRGLGPEATTLTSETASISLPEAELHVLPATMRLVAVQQTAWGWSIRREGYARHTPHIVSELSLYKDQKHIDLHVHYDKEPVLAKEAVYIAFPFAMAKPILRYDKQQGWVNPAHDALPGANHEWFTQQFVVTVSDEQKCITWSSKEAPLFTVGDIVRGQWPAHFAPRNGHLYSYVMNNYWLTNFPASQTGGFSAHYRFMSNGQWHATQAARLGREARIPLSRSCVSSMEKNSSQPRLFPAGSASLISFESPEGMILAGICGAQDGRGWIVRLQDIDGRGGIGVIHFPYLKRIHEAWRCSALEQDQERLSLAEDETAVSVSVTGYQVVSIRVVPEE